MATQNTPLLNLFGLQKMQPGAEGETGQRFYNRDSFKNTAANLAMGLNSLRLNPDASLPQRMQARIAQRKQNLTRNRTIEALRKRAEGGDKLAQKYLIAAESGGLTAGQAMSAYMQESAQIAAEGRAAARAKTAAEFAANQPLSQIAKLRADLANKRITQEDYDAQLKKLTYIPPSSANNPQSTLGKLAADLKAGLLSQEEYEAAVEKATYIAPAKDTPAASTIGKIMQDFNAGLISEEDKNNAIAKATRSGGQAFTVTTADGITVTYGGSGGNGKLTEQQSKDLGFSARIPDELMNELDKVDFALASYPDKLLDQDPTGLARGRFQNPDFQIAQTLSQQFLTPLIRKDTGAAIQAWETQLYTEMYFPRPGDTQEVIERKRDARRLAVEGLRKGLPPLLRIQVDPEFAKEFAKLQNDVLPENSALRSITKDWAAGTQPQGSLPEQAQGSDVQLESGSGSGLSIASIPYNDLVNVDVKELSDDELDIMLKRFSEGE